MRFLTRKLAATPPSLLDLDPPQIIEFEAGDQLIVECEHRIPRDVFNRLRAQLNDRSNDKVIVLEAGLKLVGRRKKED